MGKDLEEEMRDYIQGATEIVKAMLVDKEITDALAKFYMNLFTALTNEGFTPDYAVRIVCTATLPSTSS